MGSRILQQCLHKCKLFSDARPTARLLHRVERCMAKQVIRTEPAFKFSHAKEGGYILLVVPFTTFCLGIWQLRRRKWKLGLISQLESGFKAEPVPLPEDLEELKNLEFRAVKVTGEFDYTNEVYIGPRSHTPKDNNSTSASVSGVHVITPFKLADRDMTILVNRGWLAARQWLNEEYRKNGQVHGQRTLVGIVRQDQDKLPMMMDTSKTEVKNGMKYFIARQVDRIAEECHTAPVFLDAMEEEMKPGAPIGIKPVADLRNEHMQYAITWFAITSISLIMWFRRYGRPSQPEVIHKSLEARELVWKKRK